MSVRVSPEVFRNSARISLRNGQLVGVMFFFVLSLSNLFAQSDKAILSGTLVGPSGSPVPDVRISLLWNDVGSRRQSTSDDNGFFIIPALTPGSYTLQAYRDGFALVQISKIILAPGDHRNLQISFQLKPIHETVSVSSNEGTGVATVATTIDQHLVEELPLRGGSFPALFLLTPGIVMLPTTEQSATDHPFSFNGQSTNANYFTVDGVSAITDPGLRYATNNLQSGSLGQNAGYSALGTTMNFLPANSLAELNIQTATYVPATGRQAGGHVEMASRTGTSEYHGMFSESFRNSALDARDWFAVAGNPTAPTHMNDFGGSVSGPLWPYARRDWSNYFFLAYEGVRLESPNALVAYVPSLGLREKASAGLKPYLNAFPLPNGPESPGTGSALYQSSFSLPSQSDAYSLRLDNVAGNRFTTFLHYSNSPSSTTSPDRTGGVDLTTTNVRVQALTAGGTWLTAGHGVDTFRANYSRSSGSTASSLRNADGAVIPPDNVLFPGPSFGTAGATVYYRFLANLYTVGDPLKSGASQENVVNDMTFPIGSHSLSFGFDYLRSTFESAPLNYTMTVEFLLSDGLFSGDADYVGIDSIDHMRVAQENLSFYAQESWHATERLKLSYGLRWEINPSPHALDGQQLYSVEVSNIPTMGLSNGRTPLYKTRYTDFAPRMGVAYALREVSGHELLIHAGAGIFYSLGNSDSLIAVSAFPHERSSSLNNPSFPRDVPLLPAPMMPVLSPPFDGQVFMGYTPHYAEPQLYQWSVGLEQSLSDTQQILITYVGSSGHRLYVQQLLDDPNSNFIDGSVILINRSTAVSSYNALQMQYKHRLSKGFEALASYTWAHSLDNASNDTTAFDNALSNINVVSDSGLVSLASERGNSNFDLRNSFGMALTYETSFEEGRTFWNTLLNHWNISTLALAHGATPVDVVYSGILGTQSIYGRPDVVPNQPIYLRQPVFPGGKALNPDAFIVPAEQRQGTLGRNSVRGFPFWQLDLAVSRNVKVSDKVRLQWKGEFFNLFNHPNFGDPASTLLYPVAPGYVTPGFGKSNSMLNESLSGGGAQKEFQIGGARTVQMGLRLNF